MKRFLLVYTILSIEILFSVNSYACAGSNCKPCPDGFHFVQTCCKNLGDPCALEDTQCKLEYASGKVYSADCVIREEEDSDCKKEATKGYAHPMGHCCNSELTQCAQEQACRRCHRRRRKSEINL